MTQPTDQEHHPHRRRSDRNVAARAHAFWRSPALMAGLTLCALVLAAVAVILSQNDVSHANRDAEIARQNAKVARELAVKNRVTLKAIEAEGADRRDQSCILFERQANTAVRQLPQTERNARKDAVAPPYCNQPGVGLDEPSANLPARRDFSYLLRKPQ